MDKAETSLSAILPGEDAWRDSHARLNVEAKRLHDLLHNGVKRLHAAEDGNDDASSEKLARSRGRIEEIRARIEQLQATLQLETDRANTLVREVTDWGMVLAQHKLRINEFAPLRAAAASRVCVRWRSVVDTAPLSTQRQQRLVKAIVETPENPALIAGLGRCGGVTSADLSQFAGAVTDGALIVLTKGSPGLTSLSVE